MLTNDVIDQCFATLYSIHLLSWAKLVSFQKNILKMGVFLSQISKPRRIKVVVLGLDAAGKTTILYRMKEGKSHGGSIPTIGFNVEDIHVRILIFLLTVLIILYLGQNEVWTVENLVCFENYGK